MPIDLDSSILDRADAPVEFAGQTAKLTYRPTAFTPAMEADYRAVLRSGARTDGQYAAWLLCRVLISWDVTRGDDLIPITDEGLSDVPSQLLWACINAIHDHRRPKEKTEPSSDDTSSLETPS